MDSQDLKLELNSDIEQEILLSVIEDEVSTEIESVKEDEPKKKAHVHKRKKKSLKSRIQSGLQIKTVCMLLLTLVANTYAWFIFVNTSNLNYYAHIMSWQFNFKNAEEVENIYVEKIFPGMKTEEKVIECVNKGEMPAQVTFEMESLKILENEYTVGQSADVVMGDGTVRHVDNITAEFLLDELVPTFPFTLRMYVSDVEGQLGNAITSDNSSAIMTTGQTKYVTVKLEWPYETSVNGSIDDGDLIDTYWGNKAYEFYQSNPGIFSFKAGLKLVAQQATEDQNI